MDKKYKDGLCLGKYLPPHRGHQYLIDTALSMCETVHVMVCSLKNEPIDGSLRFEWVKNLYKNNPNVNVIWCEDENPQYVTECDTPDEFYSHWIKTVHSRIFQLDVVFTSETYGDEFAKYLGYAYLNDFKHELVDYERTTYPVSATAVRTNPYDVWDYVLSDTKQLFNKKVVILGPESTGKTTLINKLCERFDTTKTEEYGREYTDVSGTDNLTITDFENIAEEHLKRHNDDFKKANKVHFVDTEAIVTKIFSEMYLSDPTESVRLDNCIKEQKFDMWLLLDIDVPWVNDGTRDFSDMEIRKNHFNKLKEVLDSHNINYHIITANGDYMKRIEQAIDLVQTLFS